MSGAPGAAEYFNCDLCVGSPLKLAEENLWLELRAKRWRSGRVARFAIHVCKECRRDFFAPAPRGLDRLDDQALVEDVQGVVVITAPKRLQRKRR